ncbi:MAG: histidine phosphatase family protein [Clostridia bacterium]|nr:histidine phosphatase family protein [Clostridia bacterium]
MLFYYIRHGEPIYDPDSLTPRGKVEAEALSERLCKAGLDEIYVSTSNRARQTAAPTCKKLGIEPTLVDFANEHYAWLDFTVQKEDGSKSRWAFQDESAIRLFTSAEIRELGDRWYTHPFFAKGGFRQGVERVYNEADRFFEALGYSHERYTGRYRVKAHNDRRVALFAHQGFGLVFLSCLLDIPYPQLCTRFDMCHTGVTLIDFSPDKAGEYCIPKVLTLSNEGHLYAKGIPSNYGEF